MTIGDELTKKGIALLKVASGEVWTLKDDGVQFPGRDVEEIPRWKKRYVVVVQNERDNQSHDYETVTVVPFTTKLNGKTIQCMVFEKGEGGLEERSLAKAGFIQPILKNLLHNKKGKLTDARLFQLKSKIAANLGLIGD